LNELALWATQAAADFAVHCFHIGFQYLLARDFEGLGRSSRARHGGCGDRQQSAEFALINRNLSLTKSLQRLGDRATSIAPLHSGQHESVKNPAAGEKFGPNGDRMRRLHRLAVVL
jgi:hypothetical protein